MNPQTLVGNNAPATRAWVRQMAEELVLMALGMILLGSLAGCISGGGSRPPQPPQPPPQAPGPVCQEGQFYGCWAQPPGRGWVYVCPVYDEAGGVVGTQETGGPEFCADHPGPGPEPPEPPQSPPAGGCVLSGVDIDPVQGYNVARLGAVVDEVIARMKGCEIGPRCVVEENPQAFQAAVEAELRRTSVVPVPDPDGQFFVDAAGILLCSGQHEAHTDEIAVAVPGATPWEAFHVYAGPGWCRDEDPRPAGCDATKRGAVVWSSSGFRGAWAPRGGGGEPPPGPEPEPSACASPRPPRVHHWRGPRVHQVNGYTFDATPYIRDSQYCLKVFETQRGDCPIRPECGPDGKLEDGTVCKWTDRSQCELEATGVPLISCSSGPADIKPDNRHRWNCPEGAIWTEICDDTGTVCSLLNL